MKLLFLIEFEHFLSDICFYIPQILSIATCVQSLIHLKRSHIIFEMNSFALIVFLVAIVSISHGKKCSLVICPNFEFDMEETYDELSLNYFRQDLPQDGSCLEGTEKYIVHGKFFGYPGQTRCTCVSKDGPDILGDVIECCPGVPECPRTVPYYREEKLKDIYMRMGATYIKKGITDGCCPAGFRKFFVEPMFSGVDKRLCYCDPPSDQIIVFDGLPPVSSSSESSSSD